MNPWLLNKTGIYLGKASIQANTVIYDVLKTGVGKSHFIQKKLQTCHSHYIKFSVNEMFTAERCIKRLNHLPHEKNCAISFNFTTTYPGVSFIYYFHY